MAIPLVSRATVMSNRGIVASTSPLAASAGLRVLSQGGNAFDAAVATAAVEAVTVPGMCGIGERCSPFSTKRRRARCKG